MNRQAIPFSPCVVWRLPGFPSQLRSGIHKFMKNVTIANPDVHGL